MQRGYVLNRVVKFQSRLSSSVFAVVRGRGRERGGGRGVRSNFKLGVAHAMKRRNPRPPPPAAKDSPTFPCCRRCVRRGRPGDRALRDRGWSWASRARGAGGGRVGGCRPRRPRAEWGGCRGGGGVHGGCGRP